jgi:putative heme-binding domain-containing protein
MILRISALLFLLSSAALAAEPADADRRIVQTVQRLATFDYSKSSQKTKEAIDRYLTATAGTDEYFQLVEKFGITTQTDTLLGLATEQAGSPQAGQAVKLLFQTGAAAKVTEKLPALAPDKAAALAEAAASVGSKETTEFSAALLTSANTAAPVAEALVKGLARNAAGQQALLAAAKAGTLPEAVKAAAAAALATSTDETVRAAAAEVLHMKAAAGLPPVAELVKRAGDAAKGQPVFMAYCFTCHQVNGAGIDFGPALSEIGSKLAKEALYDSILNPSAGISFGFEGWQVKTKDGNQFLGMIASETDTELALKVPGGIIQKLKKDTISEREKMKVSIMTPNLHTVMSEDDLVNLVEYLATLKKK